MEDYNNESPYVSRPSGSMNVSYGAEGRANKLAIAAYVMGLMSVVSVLMMAVYPPMVLGGLAIMAAILSKGYETKMHKMAKRAVVCATTAIVVNVAIVAGVILLLFTDNQYKPMINEAAKELYGQSIDDMLKDAMDGELNLDYKNLPGGTIDNNIF